MGRAAAVVRRAAIRPTLALALGLHGLSDQNPGLEDSALFYGRGRFMKGPAETVRMLEFRGEPSGLNPVISHKLRKLKIL
jgi:hypothetical protein